MGTKAKAKSNLIVLAGGAGNQGRSGAATTTLQQKSDEGTAMIAYMMGVYDRELKDQKISATLRHKLCVAFQEQLLSGE